MQLSTDEQGELRSACRTVLADHSTSSRVRAVAETPNRFDSEFWKLAAELGWMALAVPENHGGLGLGLVEACVVAEELGRFVQSGPLASTLGGAVLVDRYGSDEVRRHILPLIAEGSAIVSLATDDGMPNRERGLVLRSVGAGYELSGSVGWVADAVSATHLLLAARQDFERRAVLLEVGVDGLRIDPIRSMDETRTYAVVSCSAVPVPGDAVFAPGSGELIFDVAVTLQCAESVGVVSRLLDMTVEYAQQRIQFGQPIGKFQALKHRMADMLVAREAARATTWDAARMIDSRQGNASATVSVAKALAGAAGSAVATEALQIHGGVGFSWEHDLHLFLRRAKVNELLLGSPGWHEERLAGLLRDPSQGSGLL